MCYALMQFDYPYVNQDTIEKESCKMILKWLLVFYLCFEIIFSLHILR